MKFRKSDYSSIDNVSKSLTSFSAVYLQNQVKPLGRFCGDSSSLQMNGGVSLRELEMQKARDSEENYTAKNFLSGGRYTETS